MGTDYHKDGKATPLKDARYAVTPLRQFPIKESAPEFPTDALPGPVARLVKEAVAALGCAPDFVGLAALTTLGAAIGNSRVIQPKKSWTESATLYAAVIAAPGEKKSPAIEPALRPAQRLENRLNKEFEAKLDEHARAMRGYDIDCKMARKTNEDPGPPPKRPDALRVYVNDTTLEALVPILKTNPRGVLLDRDELVGWVKSMDQYRSGGKGADRQFWLSTWSNRPVSVDRKSQQGAPLSVLRPFVSVLGAIQPTVLPELAEGREDGMLERFLFVWPDPVNTTWVEDEISEETEEAYAELCQKLRNLSLETDELGDAVEKPVVFSPEAKELFIHAYNTHRAEMEDPTFPPHLRSPWAKLEAYQLRLTLILAACRFVEKTGIPERVEKQDVIRAGVLMDYFKAQARRVFDLLCSVDPHRQLVADVVAFVREQGGVWIGSPTELHEQLESPYNTERPDELSKFLQKEDYQEEFGLLCTSDMERSKDEDGNWKSQRVLTLYLPRMA